MEHVILVIHLILALAIIAVVLLQRSEGGGLGIGGGGLGDLATARSTASALSRMTAILAGCFMGTSLLLAILAEFHTPQKSLLDVINEQNSQVEGSVEAGATTTAATQEEGDKAGDEAGKADQKTTEAPKAEDEPAAPISE